MINFVNAKINLGLQIVRKREDGYHDLQTVFYPVGKYAGSAQNPESFCDLLELTGNFKGVKEGEEIERLLPQFQLTGRRVDCPLEKNLIYKAACRFCQATGADFSGMNLQLEKHLPDGAGMGGGSADASFVLRLLADEYNSRYPENKIEEVILLDMALSLGADCPFFILNRAAYAEGVGEKLVPIELDLTGMWLVVVKPSVYISTKEAFAGVIPKPGEFDLREISRLPIEEWRNHIKNDFEDSIIPRFPEIGEIKGKLYSLGALYSSMSGSGSSVYGIFPSEKSGAEALSNFREDATIEGCYLLKM
ncbi:MAG: 4-(cytidine 5'-diphospho)-2-C-methyl-D-erythritol kinase [Bacteroidales bacterium]|nr:4-(cytidine 5'-diphospho)-2-C-methyl-D-erythritol kinase [Bacteroidales bacterium]